MLRELLPAFSGPGHILLLYALLSFLLFAPADLVKATNYGFLIAGFVAVGLPLGSLLTSLYSSVWTLLDGYAKVGYAPRLVRRYRGKLSTGRILAIHDKLLWEVASETDIEYFRRRWTVFHFSAQIVIVSTLALSFPFVVGALFAYAPVVDLVPKHVLYGVSLLAIAVALAMCCRKLSRLNDHFIAELLREHLNTLEERLARAVKEND